MKINIEFTTENDIFGDHNSPEYFGELNNVLARIAWRMEHGEPDGRVMDSNGNAIGNFSTEKEA